MKSIVLSMKKIGIFLLNCFCRNKMVVFLAIVFGISLCVMSEWFATSLNANSEMSVVVICEEKSSLNDAFITYLKDDLKLKVETSVNYEEATERLLKRTISAIIEIPEQFEEKGIAQKKVGRVLVTTLDDYANKAFLESYITTYFTSVDLLLQSADGNQTLFYQLLEQKQKSEIAVRVIAAKESVQKRYLQSKSFEVSVGFFLNLSFLFGLFIGLMILEDRKEGVFKRIQCSPVRHYEYIAGITIYYLLTALISIGIYIFYLAFGNIEIVVPLPIVCYLLLTMILIVIGIALCVSFVIKSKIGVVFTIYGIGCLTAVLGGAYFDVSNASAVMHKISQLTPQYRFMQTVRMIQKNPVYQPHTELLILGLFAVFFLLLSAALFYRQSNQD